MLLLQSRSDPSALQQTVNDLLPYFASGLPPEKLAQLGMKRDELLRRCVYDKSPCVDSQFVDKIDPEAGNCFTFNGKGNLIAIHAGEPNGTLTY